MLKRGERLIAVGALDSYAADERASGPPDEDDLSDRRHVRDPIADRDREGLAQSERRQSCSPSS